MIKCLLVAVSDYSKNEFCENLEYCKNDLTLIHSSLVSSLKVDDSNIEMCGENDEVTIEDFTNQLEYKSYELCEDDIFIFYFSGHGGNESICLSDDNYPLQKLIESIDSFDAKAKIIILDCCHAGAFSLDKPFDLDINASLDKFIGNGIAVLASCTANETSGFSPNRTSVFTEFICDAFNKKFINRKGKKSLESIASYINQRSIIWNKKNPNAIQHPVFRSFIGGTIYFDVEKYTPYETKSFYEDNDEYIIYSVEPLHNLSAKRYSVKVILKHQCEFLKIAKYEKEIVKKVKKSEIYESTKFERIFKKKDANIIWCYFGYDVDDIINSNFICRTIWVDDSQDKNIWYNKDENSYFINETFFNIFESYKMNKALTNNDLNIEELIYKSKELTNRLIVNSHKYISLFREYENKSITERQLVILVKPLAKEIHKDYFELCAMDIAPKELHNWCQYQMQIAGYAYDLVSCFDERTINERNIENKICFIKSTIKRFENSLEKYKQLCENI